MSIPWVSFPYYLASLIGMMIPLSALEDPETAATQPVGTGPFVLEEYVRDSRFVVRRNPDYWREGLPYLDEIEFRIIPDPQTRAQTLEAGGIDAMETDTPEHYERFGDMGDQYQMFRAEGMSVLEYFAILNTKVEPLNDVRVRRALASSVDQETYIETLGAGLSTPADSPWTEESEWYAENPYPEFDPDRAEALVEEYEAEKGPIELTMLATADQATIQSVELAQDGWAEVGIEVSIERIDQGNLINRVLTGDYQMATWLYFSAPDPDGEYVVLHSDYAAPVGSLAINPSRVTDDELDAALDEGRTNPDPEARRQA